MAIYLEFDGIKGNVTAEGYKDQIGVMSFSFGVGRAISMEPGNISNREATRPSISEITITKEMDNASAALFKESVTGSAGKKVKIHFVQTGADKVQEYCTYELENCLLSSYSISADGGDSRPFENITLSFSKILVNQVASDASNKGGSPNRVGYDLSTAKPL